MTRLQTAAHRAQPEAEPSLQLEAASVSVVIPTYRRPAGVLIATTSVLNQTWPPLEVIVVIDGVDDGTRAALVTLNDPRVRVLETGVNQGPAAARRFGIQHALGHYIALLDDDDEWLSHKQEYQFRLAAQEGLLSYDFIIACRVIATGTGVGGNQVLPTRMPAADEQISEYLIDRPTLFSQPGLVSTSTLLFPRSLALRVPLMDQEDHEDWSWLLTCSVRDGIPFRMLSEPMAFYHMDPAALSRSKRTNWRVTLAWAMQHRALLTGRAFSSLLATKIAYKAKHSSESGSLRLIATLLWSQDEATLLHWLFFFGIVLTPSRLTNLLYRKHYAASTRHVVLSQP